MRRLTDGRRGENGDIARWEGEGGSSGLPERPTAAAVQVVARHTAQTTDADSHAPADSGRSAGSGRAMHAAANVGIFGLIGTAAVLMLVLAVILAFLIVAAVAPGLLIQ